MKRVLIGLSTSTVIGVILLVLSWHVTGKWLSEGLDPKADGTNKYAIILGAKVNGEVPSLSLQYRLDAALAYANDFPHTVLVLSGGQGEGEDITEAEAMRRFLTKQGIAEDRLILEEESTNTYENIAFSLDNIPEEISGLTIISSDYHLTRAKWLAMKFDLQTDVVAAKTPEVVETKLTNRERLALLKTKIVGK